ncbi:MAG: hypothetical protein QOC70_199 [Verrucomicrobiota bacterium]|jgi:hypothetical protein
MSRVVIFLFPNAYQLPEKADYHARLKILSDLVPGLWEGVQR